MPSSTTHQFLVEVTTDGRYNDKIDELSDLLGGRLWSLNGVEPHGVEVTPLTESKKEILLHSNKEVIELKIEGARPELVVLPKDQYLILIQHAKTLEQMRPRGPRSDNSEPG